MNIKNTVKLSKIITLTLSTVLSFTACTKKRAAELPESQKESIFAISDFGSLTDSNSTLKLTTSESSSDNIVSNNALAINQTQRVAVEKADVQNRLKYMFQNLQINGSPKSDYQITFSVNRQFVTAYKITNNIETLSEIEKQLSKTKKMIEIVNELQKSLDSKTKKQLTEQLIIATNQRDEIIQGKSKGNLLVPLFKYQVEAFGQLKKVKNELKEETSTLELKQAEWTQATHIALSTLSTSRKEIGLDSDSLELMERLFSADKINGQVMTAEKFSKIFQVELNLDPTTMIYSRIDKNKLLIYRLVDKNDPKTNQDIKDALKNKDSNIAYNCTDEIIKNSGVEFKNGCYLLSSQILNIRAVKLKLPKVDLAGVESSNLAIEDVPSLESSNLIFIEKNATASSLTSDSQVTYKNAIRLSNLTGKEFFFRRTLEEIPMTVNYLMSGLASDILIVQFVAKKDRLVVQRVDEIVDHKGKATDLDYEEVMSLPVTYLKRPKSSLNSNSNQSDELIPANMYDAEFVIIHWTNNQLPILNSPLHYLGYGQCFTTIADETTSDLDNRIQDGVLNLSINYTAGLLPECANVDRTLNSEDIYSRNYEISANTAKVKERISFKLNDKSTDQVLVPSAPFKIKRALGYGNWSSVSLNPTKNGNVLNPEDIKYNSVAHDFRNGKVLTYTLVGLPTNDSQRRQLILENTKKVIADWNTGFKLAFKGTSLERNGDYVNYVINNENGHEVHLGDLDKNIIYFENKIIDSGVLGVSQVGANPRSGTVVSDSLVIYTGNLARTVEVEEYYSKIKDEYKEAIKNADLLTLDFTKSKEQSTAKNETLEKMILQINAQSSGSEGENVTTNGNSTQSRFTKQNPSFYSASFNPAKNEKTQEVRNKINHEYNWIYKYQNILAKNHGKLNVEDQIEILNDYLIRKKSKLDQESLNQLNAKLKSLQVFKNKKIQSRTSNLCILKETPSMRSSNVLKKGFDEAFALGFKYTLVHEMGHSLGLTHNFMGSFDKFNMDNTKGVEKNYSSVMDYIPFLTFNYNGIGLQDIYSVRAIYTGLLETTPEVITGLNKLNLTKYVKQNKYLHIDEILNLSSDLNKSPLRKWNELNRSALSTFVKDYKFCTDIDLDTLNMPGCAQFDYGSSYTEVLNNLIEDFNEYYMFGFLNLKGRETSNYSSFLIKLNALEYINKSRGFLESLNTAFKNGYINYENEQIDLLNAIVRSKYFLYSIASQPSFSMLEMDDEQIRGSDLQKRFFKYKDSTQHDITLELRSDYDILAFEDKSGNKRYDTVGFLEVKLAALNALLAIDRSNYETSRKDENLNYITVDVIQNQQLGIEETDVTNSETTQFFNKIIQNKLSPVVMNNQGNFVELTQIINPTNPFMSIISSINVLIELESSVIDDKFNFSNYFKIRKSQTQTPAENITVLKDLNQLDVDNNTVDTLKYWAKKDSGFAENLILDAKLIKAIYKNTNKEMLDSARLIVTTKTKELLEKFNIFTTQQGKSNKSDIDELVDSSNQTCAEPENEKERNRVTALKKAFCEKANALGVANQIKSADTINLLKDILNDKKFSLSGILVKLNKLQSDDQTTVQSSENQILGATIDSAVKEYTDLMSVAIQRSQKNISELNPGEDLVLKLTYLKKQMNNPFLKLLLRETLMYYSEQFESLQTNFVDQLFKTNPSKFKGMSAEQITEEAQKSINELDKKYAKENVMNFKTTKDETLAQFLLYKLFRSQYYYIWQFTEKEQLQIKLSTKFALIEYMSNISNSLDSNAM